MGLILLGVMCYCVLFVFWLLLWWLFVVMEYVFYVSIWFLLVVFIFIVLLFLGWCVCIILIVVCVFFMFWEESIYMMGCSIQELFVLGSLFVMFYVGVYGVGVVVLCKFLVYIIFYNLYSVVMCFLLVCVVLILLVFVVGMLVFYDGFVLVMLKEILIVWWIGDMFGLLVMVFFFVVLFQCWYFL